MNADKYLKLFRGDTYQKKYFEILMDKGWHCRECANKQVGSAQIAGGGGIQGLQRGTKKRPGIITETKTEYCDICGNSTNWDRWTGEFTEPNSASGIPKELQNRILAYYDYIDSIEQRRREAHELVIDHRFPMERWGSPEETNPSEMSDEEIERKFQLLKKDSSGNHNLLKSRACERCLETGKRGDPLGIFYYYEGDEDWPDNCPTKGPDAERGCIGCGWYNFNVWRDELNQTLNQYEGKEDGRDN